MNILCIVQSPFEHNGCDTYHGETLMFTTQDEDQAINWMATEIFNNWRDRHYGKNTAVTLADYFTVVNGYAPKGWIDGADIEVPEAEAVVMTRVNNVARDKSDKMKSEFIRKKKEEEAAKQRAKEDEERATYERLREKFGNDVNFSFVL